MKTTPPEEETVDPNQIDIFTIINEIETNGNQTRTNKRN